VIDRTISSNNGFARVRTAGSTLGWSNARVKIPIRSELAEIAYRAAANALLQSIFATLAFIADWRGPHGLESQAEGDRPRCLTGGALSPDG